MSNPTNLTFFSLHRELSGRPSYYSAALTALRHYLRCDEVAAGELTPQSVAKFALNLQKMGKTEATINSYLRALRALWRADRKAGVIDAASDPFRMTVKRQDTPSPGKPSKADSTERWYAVLCARHSERNRLAEQMAGVTEVFLPNAREYRPGKGGVHATDDPLIRRLVLAKTTAHNCSELQQALGHNATILFSFGSNGRKQYTPIPSLEVETFRLALEGGARIVADNLPGDPRNFESGAKVRIVGHPLFDGMEGHVYKPSPRSRTHVVIALRGLNRLLLTPSIKKQQLLLI